MNSIRTAGDSNVRAVIHQDFGAAGIRDTQNSARQIREFSNRKVAFADLQEFHSILEPNSGVCEPAFRVVRKCAVGDEAANHNGV